jgi:hypothetical protein
VAISAKHSLTSQFKFLILFTPQAFFLLNALDRLDRIFETGKPVDLLTIYSLLSIPVATILIYGFYKWRRWSVYLSLINLAIVPVVTYLIMYSYLSFYQNPQFLSNPSGYILERTSYIYQVILVL